MCFTLSSTVSPLAFHHMANSKAYIVSFLLLFTFLVFPRDVLTHNLPKVDDDDIGASCEGLQRFPSTIPQRDDDGELPCEQRSFSSIKPMKLEPKRDHHTHAIDYQLLGLKDTSLQWVDPPEIQPNYYTHHLHAAKNGGQIDSIKGFERADPPDVQPNYYIHHLPIIKSGRQIDSIKGFQRAAAHPDAQPDYHTYHLPLAKSGRQIDSTGYHHYDTKRDEIEILNMINYEDGSRTLKKRNYEDGNETRDKDDNQKLKKRNYHDENRIMKKINYDDGTEILKKRNYENGILKKRNYEDEAETLKNKSYEDEIAMKYRRMKKP